MLQSEKLAKTSVSLENTIEILEKWLNGLPYSHFLGKSEVLYPGDLKQLASVTSWILASLAKITEILGERLSRYSDELLVLANRMNEGLPEHGVELKE